MPIVGPFIAPNDYGGLKGLSTPQLLLNLLRFIHGNIDKTQPIAVMMVQANLEKAFNRVSHQLVIMDLFDMMVPGWLLRILISYLPGRNMKLKHKGVSSSIYYLPGSSPQGVSLGVLLFLMKFRGAFLRPQVPRNYLNDQCHSPIFTGKFVDDSCHARAFNTSECLS